MKRLILLLIASLWFEGVVLVEAQMITVHHDESVNGDLSGDPTSPSFTLVAGVNRWLGRIEASPPSQHDRWIVNLPANHEITAISYSRSGGSTILDGSVVKSDPFSQIIGDVTTSNRADLSLPTPLSINDVYYMQIFTDFNTSGRSWTLELTVQPVAARSSDIGTPSATNRDAGEMNTAQNYPNPFNPTTEIPFVLPEASPVTLEIFNTLGQVIRTLTNKPYPAGRHSVRWDGKDKNGTAVASGVYFYKLQAGTFFQVNKMSLIR